ncbi:unnamed protein product [Cercopithifilaria johnstoni]|uniref:Uncharacterized protein n=1 Tax=Cercopithifilaria johnstoni TaxID=2874296 RepID=A0A8J2MLC7_9BILA|nr:unnamed protein product [Cercopithifilaria johnstoni]
MEKTKKERKERKTLESICLVPIHTTINMKTIDDHNFPEIMIEFRLIFSLFGDKEVKRKVERLEIPSLEVTKKRTPAAADVFEARPTRTINSPLCPKNTENPQSHCGEGRGSHCSGSIKIPLQSDINMQKRANRTSLGGQLFLCIIGSVLSFSICIWLTGFSEDVQWRKLLFASGAALCALLFATLAAQIMRKAKQSSTEVIIPNLAARRSTIVRISRKSMCESNLNQKESGTTSLQQSLNLIPKDDATAMIERTP